MTTRNLTAVEGLRFFLFLGVFIFHCASNWLPIGWGGVQAFLVIGAYFLTHKYLNRKQDEIKIGEAFLHRIKRLYPVYVLLVVAAVLLVVVNDHLFNADSLWYLFSVQNFRCLFSSNWTSLDRYIGHFWYIGLDVWLFLLWLMLMRLVPRKHLRKSFITTLCIGLIWRTLFILLRPDNPTLAYVIPIGQLDCWSIGGLVAISINEKGTNNRKALTDIIIGIVCVLLLIVYNTSLHQCSFGNGFQLYHSAEGYMQNPLTGNIHFFIALLAAGILRYCLDTTKQHPVLSAAPLVALGGMTYELYCFHYPIRFFAKHFIHNELLMIIVALLVTYIVSLLWCRYVMPIIKKTIK